MECSSALSKFCWRMLELTGVTVLQRRKPCPLALLSRHGTEHLLLLAHVQRRVILWVYTRLSICSWKWIICSLVVQKGLPAPTVRGSSGFSLWWNVLVFTPARQRLGAPSRWSRGRGIVKISNYRKKNIQLFFFFVALACSTTIPLCLGTNVPARSRWALHGGCCQPPTVSLPFRVAPWDAERALADCKTDFLSKCLAGTSANFWKSTWIFHWPIFICFKNCSTATLYYFVLLFFSERKYLLGFEQEYYRSWCCTVGLAYFYLAFLKHLQLTIFLKNHFLALASSILSQRNVSRTALPRHGQFSDFS